MQYISRIIRRTRKRNSSADTSSRKGENQPPSNDSAVSPVIGIMLMLIITVILAAIISGYVGGMSETKSKPPQLVLQSDVIKIASVYHVSMAVLSAGDGIPTRDLKIITSWKSGTDSGGNTTMPGSKYPLGLVPNKGEPSIKDFGDYTLLGGTKMIVNNTEGDEIFFGKQYENIGTDGVVDIKIIHIPSQAMIYNQNLIVRRP